LFCLRHILRETHFTDRGLRNAGQDTLVFRASRQLLSRPGYDKGIWAPVNCCANANPAYGAISAIRTRRENDVVKGCMAKALFCRAKCGSKRLVLWEWTSLQIIKRTILFKTSALGQRNKLPAAARLHKDSTVPSKVPNPSWNRRRYLRMARHGCRSKRRRPEGEAEILGFPMEIRNKSIFWHFRVLLSRRNID
jgi:hypothetical protein